MEWNGDSRVNPKALIVMAIIALIILAIGLVTSE